MIDDGIDENTQFSAASTAPSLTLKDTATVPLLRDVFDAMQDGAALYDEDLKLILCNKKYQEYLFPPGFPDLRPGESATDLAKALFDTNFFFVPKSLDAAAMSQNVGNLIRSYTEGLELKRVDGRYLLAVSKRTSLGGYLVTVSDITDRKRADSAEKKRLSALYDAAGALEEGFALWDEDFKFVLCNQKYQKLQLPEEEAPKQGESAYDFSLRLFKYFRSPKGTTPHEFAAGTVNKLKSYVEDFDFYRKDGVILRVAVKKTGLGGYLITLLDITEERNSEAKAQHMFLDAIEALDEGLCLYDKDMRFVAANKAWGDIYWGSRKPAIGEHSSEILDGLLNRGFYAWPEGVTREEFEASLLCDIRSNTKGVALQTADGRHLIGSSHATEMDGYLLSCRDVTKQVETERELTEQRAIANQNEKLSALGELLAGVAHELNNPLSVIFGYAQMLQDKVDDPIINERIGLIGQSAERAAKIVRTFLSMARQRPTKVVAFSLNDAVNTALEVSSYSLKSNGTQVMTRLDSSVPFVDGDFDQLAQVFSNLVVNAGHAVKSLGEDGKLSIQSYYDNNLDVVVVEIKDNGPGIPEEIQARIFEPFFTTKDVGEGTGVGLAFSHRIITSHKGELTVTSKRGKGATFQVKLPASAEYIFSSPVPDSAIANSDKKTILIVDDEDGVAQLIFDLLFERGFLTTKSTSPQAALTILENQTFDVILSDFKMPGMDGEAFFQALKVIAPECIDRIGFITGDAMSENVRSFFASSGRPYIEKPVLNEELMELVAALSQNTEDEN